MALKLFLNSKLLYSSSKWNVSIDPILKENPQTQHNGWQRFPSIEAHSGQAPCEILYMHSFFVLFFFLFRVAPAACGSSWARGNSCSGQPPPQPQQHWTWATSATTACEKARFLTHWARPGIEPTSSWTLVGFITSAPQQEHQED